MKIPVKKIPTCCIFQVGKVEFFAGFSLFYANHSMENANGHFWSILSFQSLEANILLLFRNHKYPKSSFQQNYRLFSAKYVFMVKHKTFLLLCASLKAKNLLSFQSVCDSCMIFAQFFFHFWIILLPLNWTCNQKFFINLSTPRTKLNYWNRKNHCWFSSMT